MPLSPAKAAQIAGVSRTVISRALATGQLVGTKKNNGHWAIKNEDLVVWLEQSVRRAESKPAHADAPEPNTQPRPEDLRAKLTAALAAGQEAREGLAAANARLEVMDVVISNLKADRDAWQAQAEALRTRPAGLFARLFGR
jgi:hypothetical protein